MIKAVELSRRARDLAVQQIHAERDYVLNHFLSALSERSSSLVFRGGTALARVYWPDFRLSEDLDFVSQSPELGRAFFDQILQVMREKTALDLSIDVDVVREGRQRSVVRWEEQELLIDIAQDRCFLPAEKRALFLPYSDLKDGPRTLTVQSLAEILGNKWFMLMDRREPRDLFDLWHGLTRRHLPFDVVASGHEARYGYKPLRTALAEAAKSKALWETRLAHQLGDLPVFDEVLSTVEESFNRWDRSRKRH